MTVTCEIHTDEHGLGEHSAPVSYGVTLVGKAPAGYDAGIIFTYQGPDAMQQFRPGPKGTIPLLFVYRLTGLKLPGVPGVTDARTGDGGAGYVRNGDHGCVRRLGLPSIVQDGDPGGRRRVGRSARHSCDPGVAGSEVRERLRRPLCVPHGHGPIAGWCKPPSTLAASGC